MKIGDGNVHFHEWEADMYTLKTWRDPYDDGFNVCTRKEITFEEGLTVLIGCNGYGKTTTLLNLKEMLRKENIPYYMFDNLHDGGSNSLSAALYNGNMGLLSGLMCSSEGERISGNISQVAGGLRQFLSTGNHPMERNPFAMFFDKEDKPIETNKRFIIMDAVDSGYSIDNVIELKELFALILDDAKKQGLETYIVVSCNEYELANGTPCMDIRNGNYIRFKDYNDFSKFVLKTRKIKDDRYERINARRNK